MHRVMEAEFTLEHAERCRKCKEMECKQPSYVEVVYCPRFVAVDPHPNSKKDEATVANSGKKVKRMAKLI